MGLKKLSKYAAFLVMAVLVVVVTSGCSPAEKSYFTDLCPTTSNRPGDICNQKTWWDNGPTKRLQDQRRDNDYQISIDHRERVLWLYGHDICGDDSWHPSTGESGQSLWMYLEEIGVPASAPAGIPVPRCSLAAYNDWRVAPTVTVANSDAPPPVRPPDVPDPPDPPGDEPCEPDDPDCYPECPPDDPDCDDDFEDCPVNDPSCEGEDYTPSSRNSYGSDGGWMNNKFVPVSFSTTADVRIQGCVLEYTPANGGKRSVLHDPSGCPNARTLNTSSWGDGSYTYSVLVGDGYNADSDNVSFDVDTTAPSAPSFTEQPDPIIYDDDVDFYWEEGRDATSGIAYHECNLNNEGWDDCNKGHLAFANLEPGKNMFQVRAVDQAGSISATTVAYWDYQLPTPPTNTALPLLSAEKIQEDVEISTSDGQWSSYEEADISYQWQECVLQSDNRPYCRDIEDAIDPAFTPDASQVGKFLRANVTATNRAGNTMASSALSVAVSAAPKPPENTVAPVLSGDAKQGATLTISPGTWTGDNPLNYTYQWQRCKSDTAPYECARIGDPVTETTRQLTAADGGKFIRVVVIASNTVEEGVRAQSNFIGPVLTPPRNEALPTITGTAQQGQALTADKGTWSGSEPMSYTYQWQRCSSNTDLSTCANMANATAATRTAVLADVGKFLRVVVTASNVVDNSVKVRSALTAAVLSKDAIASGDTALVLPAANDGTLDLYVPAKQNFVRDGFRARVWCKTDCQAKITVTVARVGRFKSAVSVRAGGNRVVVIRASKAQKRKLAKVKGGRAKFILQSPQTFTRKAQISISR